MEREKYLQKLVFFQEVFIIIASKSKNVTKNKKTIKIKNTKD